jgi:HEAT repeat protein
LQDPDPWVKLNATWALSEIGASVPLLPHWLEALQHFDPNLRRSAAEIFQDSRSLLPKVLGAEADNSKSAVLVTALKDEDFTVRNAAKQALGLLGIGALPELVQGLKAPEPLVRLEAAELVGNLGGAAQSAVPNLLALLGDTGRYVPPTSNLYGLPLLLPVNIPRLSTDRYPPAPNNPDQLVQVNAAIALGKLGDRSAIPALTTALKDNNPWMQLATGWALLRLGQTQGLPVVGRLVQYPNASIQQAALSQLQGYGSQSASYILPYYTARLESADDNERNGAIIGIGKFGSAALDLVPKLRAMLVGKQKDSPGYAATILGQIARHTAVAWQNGSLSANQRQQAIAELTKVLNIMQAPNARFNREPIERVRNALTTLRGITR